jgi:hypothetical protein
LDKIHPEARIGFRAGSTEQTRASDAVQAISRHSSSGQRT